MNANISSSEWMSISIPCTAYRLPAVHIHHDLTAQCPPNFFASTMYTVSSGIIANLGSEIYPVLPLIESKMLPCIRRGVFSLAPRPFHAFPAVRMSSGDSSKSSNGELESLVNSLFPSTGTLSSPIVDSVSTTSTPSTNTPISQIEAPVCIVGSGPAAWTAAIYTSRAGLNPVVLEGYMANGVAAGGQLTTTTDVENYPGFPEGVQGPELCELFRKHGLAFGASVVSETVKEVNLHDGVSDSKCHYIRTDNGTEVACEALIIATGATAKRLHFPGADDYWTRGISACAVCDGGLPLFRGKTLVVVGGGDTAMEEALYLTRFADKVVIVHRRQELRASKIMAERARSHPKIEWRLGAEVVRARGSTGGEFEGVLGSLELSTGETINCGGLFFGIGHEPATSFLKGSGVELDEDGYIIVSPGKTSTNVDGVFACGDVMDKEWRQAVTAAGTGCMAALETERWLTNTRHHII